MHVLNLDTILIGSHTLLTTNSHFNKQLLFRKNALNVILQFMYIINILGPPDFRAFLTNFHENK